MMCGQYTACVRNCSAVFFLWLQFCALLVGLNYNPVTVLTKSRVNFSGG